MTEVKKLSSLTASERSSLINRQKTEFKDIEASVKKIISDVQQRGSAAVSEYVKKFDKADLGSFRVTEDEMARALKKTPQPIVAALTTAAKNIFDFQRRQMPAEFRIRFKGGALGQKIEPFARVGIYAPGGTATYPSTILMGCIPAQVAKVPEIVVCTPPRADGSISDIMLVAAELAGATEVYKIGGVQAIAAMAYGIKEMSPVNKIVGPGNKYVTVAKQLVSPDCDIEFLAGPSEILIIADETGDPEMLAYDMLAQLEHDVDAKAVLVSLSTEVASKVVERMTEIAKTLPRKEILGQAIAKGCAVLKSDSLTEAIDFANDFAAEHLLLAIGNAEDEMVNICNAGSIFLGSYSSVAFGDYCAGPNHILPTMGLAATRGALSPLDFVKIIPYQRTSRSGAKKMAKTAATIARAEGLEAHARAAEARAKK